MNLEEELNRFLATADPEVTVTFSRFGHRVQCDITREVATGEHRKVGVAEDTYDAFHLARTMYERWWGSREGQLRLGERP